MKAWQIVVLSVAIVLGVLVTLINLFPTSFFPESAKLVRVSEAICYGENGWCYVHNDEIKNSSLILCGIPQDQTKDHPAFAWVDKENVEEGKGYIINISESRYHYTVHCEVFI